MQFVVIVIVYRFCFWLRRMLWVYLPKMDIR